MVGGDRGYQRRLADLQDADPVAGRDGPRPWGLRGDFGHYFGDDIGGRRVSGILQVHHLASVVVVANHPDEPHHGSRRLMAHQLLMFGKRNRLIRQRSTHYLRHCRPHPVTTDTPRKPTIFTGAMRSVEEHQRVVAGLIAARPAVTVELPDAEGRVLSDDVTATVALPVSTTRQWTVTRCVPTRWPRRPPIIP